MITTLDNVEFVIGDHNAHTPEVRALTHNWTNPADGQVRTRGAVPRDPNWRSATAAMHAVDMPLVDQGSWASLADRLARDLSRLSDIRDRADNGKPFPSLDQDGVGYCWGHSSTHANMYLRAVMHLPYVPLSAFAVCATIKQGADEGGWGAQSMDFIMDKGQPSQSVWPQGDRNYRQYDKPATWADAALHKITEGWIDMQAQEYDRNLTYAQVITCVLCRVPVVVDFNWWSHSVCGIDAVSGTSMFNRLRADSGKLVAQTSLKIFELAAGLGNEVTAGINLRIQNSWSDSWSDRGKGVLTGSKAVPDGSVAPRVTTASVAA